MGSVYVSGILARDWLTQVLDSLALYPSGLDVGARGNACRLVVGAAIFARFSTLVFSIPLSSNITSPQSSLSLPHFPYFNSILLNT